MQIYQMARTLNRRFLSTALLIQVGIAHVKTDLKPIKSSLFMPTCLLFIHAKKLVNNVSANIIYFFN